MLYTDGGGSVAFIVVGGDRFVKGGDDTISKVLTTERFDVRE